MPRTTLVKILRIILLVVVVALAARFFLTHKEEFGRLANLTAGKFLLLSSLVIAMYTGIGLRLLILMATFKVRLRPVEWIGLPFVNSLGNYLLSRSGAAAKAVYLKRKHDFSYTAFITTLGASQIIMVAAIGMWGTVASLTVGLLHGKMAPLVTGFFAGITILALAFFLFSPKIRRDGGRLRAFWAEFFESWATLKARRRSLAALFLIDLYLVALFGLRLFFAFRFLDIDASLSGCLLTAPMIELSAMLSITPADLGIRETIIGTMSMYLGTGFSPGLIAASLDRSVAILWTFGAGSFFGFLLARRPTHLV